MSAALLQVAVGLTVFTLLISIPAATFLKFFARPLTWGQALIISIFCFAITAVLLAVYFFVKATTGIPSFADSFATIPMLIVTGVLITWRARAYGIEKTGWLGIGGKTILSLLAFGWVLVGVCALITRLKH
ncbi:hypothetical protein V1291_003934 [Nitrobacteraceae bacterium AZCC 1564]